MPPRKNSRHAITFGLRRSGKLILSTSNRFGFREFSDTIIHQAVGGDTIYSLAEKYYGEDGWRFWWAIAGFQPNPIIDPTVALTQGQTIYIPSRRVLNSYILDTNRRYTD